MLAGKTAKARRPDQALFQAPHLRQERRMYEQAAAPSFRASNYSDSHQTSFHKSAGGPRYQQYDRPIVGAGLQDRAIPRSAARFDQVRLSSVTVLSLEASLHLKRGLNAHLLRLGLRTHKIFCRPNDYV